MHYAFLKGKKTQRGDSSRALKNNIFHFLLNFSWENSSKFELILIFDRELPCAYW